MTDKGDTKMTCKCGHDISAHYTGGGCFGFVDCNCLKFTPAEPAPVATFKYFRCLSCGFNGSITTEEIAKHRASCSHGATVAMSQAEFEARGEPAPVAQAVCNAPNGSFRCNLPKGHVLPHQHVHPSGNGGSIGWNEGAFEPVAASEPPAAGYIGNCPHCGVQLGFGHLPETCKGPDASEPEKPPIPDVGACPRCALGKNIFQGSCIVCHGVTDHLAALLKQMTEKITVTLSQVAELTAALEAMRVSRDERMEQAKIHLEHLIAIPIVWEIAEKECLDAMSLIGQSGATDANGEK